MPHPSPWRGRALAALVHLGGSLLVAGLAATLVFIVWYPAPFTALAGGMGLFTLITAVDVVMGPVITFAIFDRRKPMRELQRDLAIVVLLQLAALGYGLYVMHAARPVALALEGPRFRMVSANAVLVQELPQAPPALRSLSHSGPVVLRTEPPRDSAEAMSAIEMALSGADLGVRPRYWRTWDDEARLRTRQLGQPVAELRRRYANEANRLDQAFAATGRPPARLLFLPIISRFADGVALVDADTGDVVGVAPFNGF